MKDDAKIIELYNENISLECKFWKELYELKEIINNAKKELDIK